ncbi:hypothetical protein BH10BDE1_BH10BDE1_30630 [soil metagenome]
MMRAAFALLVFSVLGVFDAPTVAQATMRLSLSHEIRYQVPRGNWIRLRFDSGEVELVDEANRSVQMLSLRSECRAGTPKFFSEFQKSYRRGLVLDEPKLIRPDSVLVEESKEGSIKSERYDRSSGYAKFLRTTESQFSVLVSSPIVKCPAVKK